MAIVFGIGAAAFTTIAVAGRGPDVIHAIGLVLAIGMVGALVAALVLPVNPPADEAARRRSSTGLVAVAASSAGIGAITAITGPRELALALLIGGAAAVVMTLRWNLAPARS